MLTLKQTRSKLEENRLHKNQSGTDSIILSMCLIAIVMYQLVRHDMVSEPTSGHDFEPWGGIVPPGHVGRHILFR